MESRPKSLLEGVVAYVEVRSSNDNRTSAICQELEQLGAQVVSSFTDDVTHIVFKEGMKRTWNKAVRRNIPMVSVSWLESCKRNNVRMPEQDFPAVLPEENNSPLPVLKRNGVKWKKMKSMQPSDFDEELARSAERGEKRRKRLMMANRFKLSDDSTPTNSPVPILALETQARSPFLPALLRPTLSGGGIVPDTPPSMKERLERMRREQKELLGLDEESPTAAPRLPDNMPLQRKLFGKFSRDFTSTEASSDGEEEESTNRVVSQLIQSLESHSDSSPHSQGSRKNIPVSVSASPPTKTNNTSVAVRTSSLAKTNSSKTVHEAQRREPFYVGTGMASTESSVGKDNYAAHSTISVRDHQKVSPNSKVNCVELASEGCEKKEACRKSSLSSSLSSRRRSVRLTRDDAKKSDLQNIYQDDSKSYDCVKEGNRIEMSRKRRSLAAPSSMSNSPSTAKENCTASHRPSRSPLQKSSRTSTSPRVLSPLSDLSNTSNTSIKSPQDLSQGKTSGNSPNAEKEKSPIKGSCVQQKFTVYDKKLAPTNLEQNRIVSAAVASVSTSEDLNPTKLVKKKKNLFSEPSSSSSLFCFISKGSPDASAPARPMGEYTDCDGKTKQNKHATNRKRGRKRDSDAAFLFSASDSNAKEENKLNRRKSRRLNSPVSKPETNLHNKIDKTHEEKPKKRTDQSRNGKLLQECSRSESSGVDNLSLGSSMSVLYGSDPTLTQVERLTASRRSIDEFSISRQTSKTKKGNGKSKIRREGLVHIDEENESLSEKCQNSKRSKSGQIKRSTSDGIEKVNAVRKSDPGPSMVDQSSGECSGRDSANSVASRSEEPTTSLSTRKSPGTLSSKKTASWKTIAKKSSKTKLSDIEDINNSSMGKSCDDEVEEEASSQLRHARSLVMGNAGTFSSSGNNSLVVTSLHRHEQEVVYSVVKKMKVFHMTNDVQASTSHVVCGEPRRTLNVLRAIAQGCWLLRKEWVLRSLEAGEWLFEEEFEMDEFPAAKESRVARQRHGEGYKVDLFSQVGPIYVSSACTPSRKDLVQLIRICSGNVIGSEQRAVVHVGLELIPDRQVVSPTWVLDSITQLRPLPVGDYVITPTHSQRESSPEF